MLPATYAAGYCGFRFGLKANDGGIRPELSGDAPFRSHYPHSLPLLQDSEGGAGCFSEGIFTFDWNRFPVTAL